MKSILKSLLWGQKARRQWGFTLIEMVVALAVSALVLVGTVALFRYLAISTSAGADQTMANLQVQYVSFWIGEDVVQAGNITLGNSTVGGYQVVGFPFTLTLVDKDGGNYTVTYSVGQMPAKGETLGNTLMSLYRTTDRSGGGNITVAEYLDPQGTTCQLQQVGNETYNLVLTVNAKVDLAEASGTYHINPRVYHGPDH